MLRITTGDATDAMIGEIVREVFAGSQPTDQKAASDLLRTFVQNTGVVDRQILTEVARATFNFATRGGQQA